MLPFHYYLALREDWVKSNTAVPTDDGDDEPDLNEDGIDVRRVDFNAEAFRGGPT